MADDPKGQAGDSFDPTPYKETLTSQFGVHDASVLDNPEVAKAVAPVLDAMIGKHKDAIRGMNAAQQQAAELKQLESLKDIQEAIDTVPGFADHLRAFKAEEGSGPNLKSLDPVQREIEKFRAEFDQDRMERQFSAISEKGLPLTDADKVVIEQQVRDTGNNDVMYHYRALKFDDIVKSARETARQEAMQEAEKRNSQGFSLPSGSSSGGAAPVDTSQMSAQELDRYQLDRIADLMGKD